MASYPEDLQYVVSQMPGWSVNTARLIPVSLETVNPGNYLTINLPENTLVDLKSLVVMGDAIASVGARSGTGTANLEQVVFPRGSWSLIDQISVTINGTTVDASCSAYHHLHKLFWDMEKGDRKYAESVLEWTLQRVNNDNANLACIGLSSDTSTTDSDPTSASSGTITTPTGRQGLSSLGGVQANSSYYGSGQNAWPFILRDFKGFLGCGKIIDTSTLGQVQIQFRFAPNDILMKGRSVDGAVAYQVQNLRAFVNVCDVQDGIYYAALSERLQTAPLQIPFKHYISIFAPKLDGSGSVRFSVQSRSIDAVFAILRPVTPTVVANYTGYMTPINSYFARKFSNQGFIKSDGTALTPATKWVRTTQLTLNSINYPMFAASPAEQYWLALNAFRQMHEDALSPTPELHYFQWHDILSVFAYRFSHSKGLEYTSGVNTQGLSAGVSIEYIVDGSGSEGLEALPLVFVETSAVLSVAAYRSISVTV